MGDGSRSKVCTRSRAAARGPRWCSAAHRSMTSPCWPHRASKQWNTLSSRLTLKVRPRPSLPQDVTSLWVRDGGINLQQEVSPQQTERPPRDSSEEDSPDRTPGLKCNIQADGGRYTVLSDSRLVSGRRF